MANQQGMLSFELVNSVQVNPDGSFTIYVEPSGITVAGPTKEIALQKAKDAMMVFMKAIRDKDGVSGIQKYLDHHNVAYRVKYSPMVINTTFEIPVEIEDV